ncbi:RNA polymerase sigma factor [Streptomyces hydrogenans]|uniref:RNA polymerase sigma factor n=1 Tax=Streptomyces hydrogenans TaxID=1873719 RepID=UPI0036B4AA33
MSDLFAERLQAVHRDKGKALRRLARRELASENLPSCRADAEDIVQDALVIVLTNSDRTEIDSVYDYLCAVIRNRVRDLSRRKAAAPLDTTAPTAEGHTALWVSDVELDIDAALDAEREAGRVLGKLSPQQRRLILLAEGWEYTHAEIAQITGLNRGTVATHIRRAKIALTIGAAVAAVIVTVLINWLPRGSTRPRWYDIGSAPWLGGPTLAVPVLAFAAFLAAAALIYFFEYRRIARRSVERARHTEVLNLMINTTGELAARRPRMAPTPADYAAHLGIPEEWITLDTLYHGDTRQPPGTRIALLCRFSDRIVDGIIANTPRNTLPSRTPYSSSYRPYDNQPTGRGYGGDGAEGAP